MGFKNRFAAILTATVMTALTPISAAAQTGTVTADLLNIRSLASTNSSVVTQVSQGDVIDLLSFDGTWYEVKTSDGKTGFASGNFVTPNPSYYGKVTASSLMVRSSTGTSSPVIAKLTKDSTVELLAYDGSWYKVLTSEGLTGYASANYIVVDYSITSMFPQANPTYDLGHGYVSCNLTRLHESTGEYSTVTALLTKGEKLDFLAYDGAWYKVRRESGEEGFVSVYFVTLDQNSVSNNSYDCPIPGYIDATVLNVRMAPNTTANVISAVKQGSEIALLSYDGSWYKTRLDNGNIGYVSANYVSLNPVEYIPSTLPQTEVLYVPKVAPTDATYSLGNRIVETAYTHLGKPYRYADEGPDTFDCSGFTMYVMNEYGIKLPRRSVDQFSCGFSVSKDELIAGDLVFFSSKNTSGVAHVGIYVGDGYFIHASSGKAYAVTVSALSQNYYTQHYLGAKRVI